MATTLCPYRVGNGAMDNIRVVLFAALAFVLLLIWQAWERDYGAVSQNNPASTSAPAAEAKSESPAAPGASPPEVPTVVASQKAPQPAAASADISVRTGTLDVKISLTGGDIVQALLPDYPVSLNQPDQPFTLLDQSPKLTFIAQGGLVGSPAAPNHRDQYVADAMQYTMADGTNELVVPLHWHSADGINVTKTYVFHRGSHVVDVRYQIANHSSVPWKGRWYGQLQRVFEKQSHGLGHAYTYTGAAVSSPEKRYEKLPFKKMGEDPLKRDIQDGWAAILQHYFVAAIIPDTSQTDHYYTKVVGKDRFIIGTMGPEKMVAPGASTAMHYRIYAGPKQQDKLAKIAPGLELTVDYGALWFIAKPLFWLLEHIHGLTGNWGWSIILLTMLVKGLFYRLSAASYRSMAKMRAVQPRLAAMKERYSNDRAKLNQAMMEMYKQEKINPLGGCLPVVIQIPVFLSLYWVLLESVELRQAPFIFWIKDLASPDPYYVLPLLMAITMFVQQKLNPSAIDPMQQKVMQVLPLVFGVFFAFFQSGLVLYWFVNNLLSIGQQWLITRSIMRDQAKPSGA